MHDAPHELLVGHAGQLEVNWNASGEVGNGGHDLPGEECSGAIRNRAHTRGKNGSRPRGGAFGHCLFCIMTKALSPGVTTASRRGTLLWTWRRRGHRPWGPRSTPVRSGGSLFLGAYPEEPQHSGCEETRHTTQSTQTTHTAAGATRSVARGAEAQARGSSTLSCSRPHPGEYRDRGPGSTSCRRQERWEPEDNR